MVHREANNRHVKAVVTVDLGDRGEIVRAENDPYFVAVTADRDRLMKGSYLVARLSSPGSPSPIGEFALDVPVFYRDMAFLYLDKSFLLAFNNAKHERYVTESRLASLSQINNLLGFQEFVAGFFEGERYAPQQMKFEIDVSEFQKELAKAMKNPHPDVSLRYRSMRRKARKI